MNAEPTQTPVSFVVRLGSFALFMAIVVVILGLFEFPLPGVADRLAQRSSDTGTLTTVTQVKIRPWSHIRLDTVTCLHHFASGTNLSVVSERVYVRYRLITILRNVGSLKKAVVPLLHWSTPVRPEELWPVLANLVSSVTATNTDATIAFNNGTRAQAKNISVNLHPRRGAEQPTLAGEFKADSLQWGTLFPFANVRCDLNYHPDTLALESFKGNILDGTLRGEGVLSLDPVRIAAAEVRLRKIDLGCLYPLLPGSRGTLGGQLDGKILFSESTPVVDSLRVQGEFTINNMTASQTPLQKDLFMFLALPDLRSLEFKSVQAPFSFADGVMSTPAIEALGEPFSCTSGGWVSVRGKLYQDVAGRLSPRYVKSLNKVVAETLVPTANGGRSFSFTIRGDWDNPRISHDRETLKRAVRNVFRSFKGNFFKKNR